MDDRPNLSKAPATGDSSPAREYKRVVEGIALLDRPGFSVQYHPEAAAGPHDAGYLFDRFTDLMEAARAEAH